MVIESQNIKKTVALALIYESKEKILMQLRDFERWISHPGQWSFFGGALETGENASSAIVRELREELNFQSRSLYYFSEFFYKKECAAIHLFLCQTDLTSNNLKLQEGQEMGVFHADQIIRGELLSNKWQSYFPVSDFAVETVSLIFNGRH